MEEMQDVFNETENEFNALSRTPVSFLIVGKPGGGKTTLARKLSAVWKCQLINEISVIEEFLTTNCSLAKKALRKLCKGHELDECFVAEVISNKLNSPEVQHYGYVLDCLPSYDNSWKSVDEQLQFLKGLKQSPIIIINLKIPDVDLMKRRMGQKVDPVSNEVFVKSSYTPEVTKQSNDSLEDESNNEDDDDEDDKREGDNDSEQDQEELDEFLEDLEAIDELQVLAPDIADRLVVRKNDKQYMIEQEISYYRQHVLRSIEDYIVQHNRQYVIELDANLPPKQLFRSLLVCLSSLGLPRAVAPKRLFIPEEGEEDDETVGLDTDLFLSQLSSTGVVNPHFRWRRSLWGKFCPVELAKGNIMAGQLKFSVGILDKMYSLSSIEALELFCKCPRKYLLPPNPRVPCKICVLGPPSSGKTTLAKGLAKHFNAKVVDVESFIGPVLESAQNKAIQEAQDKVKEEVKARLAQVAFSSENGELIDDDEDHPTISDDHPEIEEAILKVQQEFKPIEPTAEFYVEALNNGITDAESTRKEYSDDTRSHGGWIIDGFPFTRNHWSLMIDSNSLPDVVLNLECSDKENDNLLQRFCNSNQTSSNRDDDIVQTAISPNEVDNWKKKTSEYNQQWAMLVEAIKGTSFDPFNIDCMLSTVDILKIAIDNIEGILTIPTMEVAEDDEIDDDPINENDENDDFEIASKNRKPWGDSSYFCPVMLKNNEVLWPGNPEISLRYKERQYSFSSDEAKEIFTSNPTDYIANTSPLKPPATRIFLIGPRGSGKSVVGRQLAQKTGLFHISFRQFLQDIILPKMKRPPLIDLDDFEDENDYNLSEENDNPNDIDDDIREALNDKESEIRAYLLHGDQLQDQFIEELLLPFWKDEPYRSTGFILEGFPSQGDELRFVCSKGLFPDAVCIFEADEDIVINRLMPFKMEIWKRKQDKKNSIRNDARQKILHEWEEQKAKRRTKIEDEYHQKKVELENEGKDADISDEEGDLHDPFFDEYQEQLAELEAEDPPEEEQYDEEGEEDFYERTVTNLKEKHDDMTDNISTIKEVLEELQVPYFPVQAGRKSLVVLYCIEKVLARFLYERDGLLTKCTVISSNVAKKLLDQGYKHLSKFGRWCPVQLSDTPESILPPLNLADVKPVIYRSQIYYLSSENAISKFQINPDKYLIQSAPSLPVPIRIAVVGPPKSGKTTVAKRFCNEFGCLRLSVGEAIRKVIADFPNCDLSEQILLFLKKGQSLPDELCVLALERTLLDIQCSTRGYVLDGWPFTLAQAKLLRKYQIVPVAVIELIISDDQVLMRAELDRTSENRLYLMNDSPAALMVKSGTYHKNLISTKSWYSETYNNWYAIDGERNKWYVWNNSQEIGLNSILQIQQYLIRINNGKASSIYRLCITSSDFLCRLGELGNYCPVCLKINKEFVDLSGQKSHQFAIEYKGYYYRTCGTSHCKSMLQFPDVFVGEDSCNFLPPENERPRKITEVEVKEKFPLKYAIQGYCPVTYVEGMKRFENLVSGLPQHIVEYKGLFYTFTSDEKLMKFMRSPYKYDGLTIPVKTPPIKNQVNVTLLPMLGYLEQSMATCIINGLTAVGCLKPKFPFITASQSGQVYLAMYLKAYNHRESQYVREKYRQRMLRFETCCQLVTFLTKKIDCKVEMNVHKKQMKDFQTCMASFLSLSN